MHSVVEGAVRPDAHATAAGLNDTERLNRGPPPHANQTRELYIGLHAYEAPIAKKEQQRGNKLRNEVHLKKTERGVHGRDSCATAFIERAADHCQPAMTPTAGRDTLLWASVTFRQGGCFPHDSKGSARREQPASCRLGL